MYEQLKALLEKTPDGPICDASEIKELLVDCWKEFVGGDAEAMAPRKLRRDIENVSWNAPILKFRIERHGAVVLGSGLANIQEWHVNIPNKTAACKRVQGRRVRLAARKMDTAAMANDLAKLIISQTDDPRLTWTDDNTVRLDIGEIIPESGPKQTVATRRKRFKAELATGLSSSGWVAVPGKVNTFRRI